MEKKSYAITVAKILKRQDHDHLLKRNRCAIDLESEYRMCSHSQSNKTYCTSLPNSHFICSTELTKIHGKR